MYFSSSKMLVHGLAHNCFIEVFPENPFYHELQPRLSGSHVCQDKEENMNKDCSKLSFAFRLDL